MKVAMSTFPPRKIVVPGAFYPGGLASSFEELRLDGCPQLVATWILAGMMRR
jgi:hypothetical protein